jgi:hypothetical protein
MRILGGGAIMTGSSLVPVIVPIVAVLAMAVWLGLVFYAAAHPRWKRYDVLPGSATGADTDRPGGPARPAGRNLAAVTKGQGGRAAPAGQARSPAAPPQRAA